MSQIKRGDIYYIESGFTTGSEQRPGRPAIVVSNDKNNEFSSTVEVVYLTTQPKHNLPTHVTIRSLSRESIAICEQITTVALERVGDYRGHISDAEMTQLEMAMLCSLDLYLGDPPRSQEPEVVEVEKDPDPELLRKLAEAETKYAVLQQMYDALLGRVVRAG